MPNELRWTVLKAMAALPFAPIAGQTPSREPIHVVSAREDRTGQSHNAARADSHLDFKVLTAETNGALFIMENRDMVRGGPPRHIHFDQEEWFLVIEGGEVAVEIGDVKLTLEPGDSVLAPRNVPHVWAYLGDRPDVVCIHTCGEGRGLLQSNEQAGRHCRRPAGVRNTRHEGGWPAATDLMRRR
jgi:mannose-6-phosphate isomerase-like protein (cupin superfamily)